MLPLLTKYLFQYKSVTIPHVGSFEMHYQPAALDVADKSMSPPSFTTEFISTDVVSEHQSQYFADQMNAGQEDAASALKTFGEDLRQLINAQPWNWNGLGTLKRRGQEIVFQSEDIRITGLEGIPVSRVIRENASHRVLVGDVEHSSTVLSENRGLIPDSTRRSYRNLVGWILLGLSIVVIIWLLYRNAFNPAASGFTGLF